MTNLLIRLFVGQEKEPEAPAVRERIGMLSGCVGIVINLLLFAGKFTAGTIAGSVAILADGFNNLSDAGSSIVTLIGFRLSGKGPDHEHPFGHGRMEYLAGLVVGIVILLFSVELAKSSVEKILNPAVVEWNLLIGVVLFVAILAKIWMFLFNRTLSSRIHSAALKAVSWDSLSDVGATSVVLAGTLISNLVGVPLDGYLGVLVALFILYTGITSIRDTLNPILGTQSNADLARRIEQTVLSRECVLGIHDLIIHDYGPGRFMVSLHAEVPCSMDVLEIHTIIDGIEQELEEKFGCEAVIHMDPTETEDGRFTRIRDLVSDCVREIDEALTIHDFRITQGASGEELVFDVVVPHQFRLSDDAVVSGIRDSLMSLDPGYHAVIRVDKPYYPEREAPGAE